MIILPDYASGFFAFVVGRFAKFLILLYLFAK